MAFLDKNGVERLWLHTVSRLDRKVDKVHGKGLSANDFTDAEKEKLARISIGDGAGIQVTLQADWEQNDETANDYIQNRTHYEEPVEQVLEQTTITDMDGSPISVSIGLVEGKEYTVIVNGVEYDCVAERYTGEITEGYEIFENSIRLKNEVIEIVEFVEPFNGIYGIATHLKYVELSENPVFEVKTKYILKKLDPKFLPEISSVEVDTTLSVEGVAADAKAVGDAIATIEIPSIDGLATEEYVQDQIADMHGVQPINRFNHVNIPDDIVFQLSGNNQAGWMNMWSGSYLNRFFGDKADIIAISRVPYAQGSFLRIPLNLASMNVFAYGEKHLKFYISSTVAVDPDVLKNKLTASIEMADDNDPTTFSQIATYSISGGWNTLILPQALYTIPQPNLRLLIGFAEAVSDVGSIGIGYLSLYSTSGSGNSNLANTGHLYDYDNDQNATFPAKVTVTNGFYGSGTYITALDANQIQYGIVDIKHGGTSAMEAGAARMNLGAASQSDLDALTTKVTTLEEEIAALKAILNNNNILVVD